MSTVTSATLGFPRIGDNRQLKRALESYWSKKISETELIFASKQVEEEAWRAQLDAGIDFVGVGDFSLYDHMLDWTVRFGLIPKQYSNLKGLDQYFSMARGSGGIDGIEALDMTKWFDMNYHYLQPKIDAAMAPNPDFSDFLDRVKRAIAFFKSAKRVRPIVVGPVTYSALSKLKGITVEALTAKLRPVYKQLFANLVSLGVDCVQLHEPILATTKGVALKEAFDTAFDSKMGIHLNAPKINLVTYFDDIGEIYPWVTALPVAAISLDFTRGNTLALVKKYGFPKDKILGAGLISGRNVWRLNKDRLKALPIVKDLVKSGISICVQPSCSLMHVPYTKTAEGELEVKGLKAVLSFAVEKLDEISVLKSHLSDHADASNFLQDCDAAWNAYSGLHKPNADVANRLSSLDAKTIERSNPFHTRSKTMSNLPWLPTTTIGSFPQTKEVRSLRFRYRKGRISLEEYRRELTRLIAYTIGVQEGLGLDLLVHGEMERTDMVEYFGQQLEGVAFTVKGWVQSYGSRCVRPPIICHDVTRPEAMTVWEFNVAQSMTKKPVKGMLTGPVTILSWSFPREDVSEEVQAMQLALCLRDEVSDLQKAGATHIQIDEPGLRELLPLRDERHENYLKWAVDAFKLSASAASDSTCIHTHMCYAEFDDVMAAIDGLDADVISIENSRSGNETIENMLSYGYSRAIGPGVYDIHSPNVPSVANLKAKVKDFIKAGLPLNLMVINPDCGLKTRNWKEVIPALRNMVIATDQVRAELPSFAKAGLPVEAHKGEHKGCGGDRHLCC